MNSFNESDLFKPISNFSLSPLIFLNKKKFKFIKYLFLIFFIILAFFLFILPFLKIFVFSKIQPYNEHTHESLLHATKKYKIFGITYANYLYRQQKLINMQSAFEIGKVDFFRAYDESDIDEEFRKQNEDILNRKRGGGFYLWKPYFILKSMEELLDYGDYLIYSDAGSFYVKNVNIIINNLISKKIDVWAYQLTNNHLEKHWSKKDAFILLNADKPEISDTPQIESGFQYYKKTNFTINFLREVLHYSKDKRIITDEPNTLGKPNYKGFKENRHDQTVLSILLKKYRLAGSYEYYIEKKKKIKLPRIFCLTRKKKFINLDEAIKYSKKNKNCIEYN